VDSLKFRQSAPKSESTQSLGHPDASQYAATGLHHAIVEGVARRGSGPQGGRRGEAAMLLVSHTRGAVNGKPGSSRRAVFHLWFLLGWAPAMVLCIAFIDCAPEEPQGNGAVIVPMPMNKRFP